MKHHQRPLNIILVLAGFLLLVTIIVHQAVAGSLVNFQSINPSKDENDFAKVSLAADSEIIIKPFAEAQLIAAGAFGEEGQEVFSWRITKRWPIASLTKLMTALIALENMKANETVTITEEAISSEGAAGNFLAGEKFKVIDLVKAILLVSSNDAATALALHFGKTNFIETMNKKARDLGMTDTNFADPTGLSLKNQSTIIDLWKLTEYLKKARPEIFEITSKIKDTITEIKTGKRRSLSNINIFAGENAFLGGKTGSLPEAGGNLISLFKIAGATKTIIVLGAEDRFEETKKIKNLLWP